MKKMGTRPGIVKSALMGTISAMVLSLGLLMIMAKLISSERLGESAAAWVFGIRAVAVLVGCLIGNSLAGEKRLVVCSFVTGGYLLVLLLISLALGDGVADALTGGVSSLLGGAIAIILGLLAKRSGVTRKKIKGFR